MEVVEAMQECVCPQQLPLPELQYWGALHQLILDTPGAVAAAGAAAGSYVLTTLHAWSELAAAAGYQAAVAVATPLGSLLALLGAWLIAHQNEILGLLLLLTAWQLCFPSRWLLRLLAKLPYCQGVVFEFPPSHDTPAAEAKYVALTFDDGPCPRNTLALLEELHRSGAKATFFITGSHVEECDVLGVAAKHVSLGYDTLQRMYQEGHELGNHSWRDFPSILVGRKKLYRELCDTHQVLANARVGALIADSDDGLDPDAAAPAPPPPSRPSSGSTHTHTRSLGSRTRWFRPAWAWFTPDMVDTAHKMGYNTVLGSVWAWDAYCSWPLLNALYICAMAYSGAVIVLHDRRHHVLPTVRYVLRWLKWLGYDMVTLSEAARRAKGGSPELTPAALAAHDLSQQGNASEVKAVGPPNRPAASAGGSVMRSTATFDSNAEAANGHYSPHLHGSAAELAQLHKDQERAAQRAALDQAEQQRLKALKREEADKRAGIDRKLADMSAAEKRAIERRAREKKEAEIRKAKRKVEEAKAKERYEQYMKEKVEREAKEAQQRQEAKAREERRKQAEEEYARRKEAERAAAAEMARLVAKSRDASGGPHPEITAATSEGGSTNGDSYGNLQGAKKSKGSFSFLRKLGGRSSSSKLGSRDNLAAGSSSGALAAAASAAGVGASAAAAAGLAGSLGGSTAGDSSSIGPCSVSEGAGVGANAGLGVGAGDSAFFEPLAAELQVPTDTYGWYGDARPAPDSLAALARIDAAVAAVAAATAAGTPLPPAPASGAYVFGPGERVLLGFDGRPLLMSKAQQLTATEAPSEAPAHNSRVHSSSSRSKDSSRDKNHKNANKAAYPSGSGSGSGSSKGVREEPAAAAAESQQQPVLLNSQGQPLVGPHGEKVVLLLGVRGMPLADPYGRPVFVAEDGEGRLLGVHPDGSIITVPAPPAPGSSSGGSHGSSPIKPVQRRASATAAGMGHMSHLGSSSTTSSTSGDMSTSGVPANAKGGLLQQQQQQGRKAASSVGSDAGGTSASSIKEASSTAPSLARTSTHTSDQLSSSAAAAAAGATAAAAWTGRYAGQVPAQLLLGPSGKPLLGLDNRPLIVAVDGAGVPLSMGRNGQALLGPDNKPLHLALTSDGTLLALDSSCRPLAGPDGCAHIVALDHFGRPMADAAGHAIIVALGPSGFVIQPPPPLPPAAPATAPAAGEAGETAGAAAEGAAPNYATAALLAAGVTAGVTAGVAGCVEWSTAAAMVHGEGGGAAVVDAADYGAYAYSNTTAGMTAAAAAGPEAATAAAAAANPLPAAAPAAAPATIAGAGPEHTATAGPVEVVQRELSFSADAVAPVPAPVAAAPVAVPEIGVPPHTLAPPHTWGAAGVTAEEASQPAGKVRLSSQGVAVTATSHGL